MEFLDLIETVNANEASVDRLFTESGSNRIRPGSSPRYRQALAEAARLYADVVNGRKPMHRLKEAMSTSDFQYLFADVVDRQMLASYREYPVMWREIARMGRVRDFRTVKRFTLDGGEATLGEVKQLEEYPAAALTDGYYTYSVTKFGRRLPFSWEMFQNDDLDALREQPMRLARAARRSEERFATDLFAGTTGPDGTFFSAGNKNVVTGNPILGIPGLQTAMQVLASQVDTDGNPIYVEAVKLVVPPALEVTARNILNATQIDAADGGGDGNSRNQLRVNNWMSNRVQLVVNPWLPIISTTNGNTSWYLFADPGVDRPAMEIGFMTGRENPELWMKSPNAVRVGGGLVGAEEGDFDTDSIEYKVRHVFGGTLMDPKSAVASNGTGS